jgi:hypothetical protein
VIEVNVEEGMAVKQARFSRGWTTGSKAALALAGRWPAAAAACAKANPAG